MSSRFAFLSCRWQPSGWRGVLGSSLAMYLLTVLTWRLITDLSWSGTLLVGLVLSAEYAALAAWQVRHPRSQRRRRRPWPQDLAPPARRD